jgi:hypothetical protein
VGKNGAFKVRNKYNAVKTNGYASKRESSRADALKLLQRAGLITELREQVVYVLAPSVVIQGRKRPPLRYIADFVYWEIDQMRKNEFPNGKFIVEDVKGKITDGYRIKRHLMKSVHGIDILET